MDFSLTQEFHVVENMIDVCYILLSFSLICLLYVLEGFCKWFLFARASVNRFSPGSGWWI